MPTRTFKDREYEISPAHPAAEAFPWQTDDELQALADDIAGPTGQRCRIKKLPDGRIYDGRNRELACRIAGVEPLYTTEELTDAEVFEHVIALNMRRRDLTPSQKAMITTELEKLKHGGNRKDQDVPGHLETRTELAERMGVSESSVARAAKVKNSAPELADAVKQGELDVKTAAKVADLPPEQRQRVAEAEDKKEAAKEVLAAASQSATAPNNSTAASREAAVEGPDNGAGEFVAALDRVIADADKLARQLDALRNSPFAYCLHAEIALDQFKAGRTTLFQGRPIHVCPHCDGKSSPQDCVCKGTGRVKSGTYKRLNGEKGSNL